MSYLVLARKYRPLKFAEVVGQEHVTRTLANAFAALRVHHAFLFCGPRGCGKTTIARIVGKALNCEQRGESAEPCGTCSACTSIANGSAVDYIEMDGASNRGIDAIRELTEAVRYQPAVLRKKVYVIDEVHMLTTEAFNALLKTLEEPPPHVTFMLATTEPHKLPNTILSRCQRYDFKLVPASRLAQHLTSIFEREGLKIGPAAVSLLVRESGGSVRDALSLCDQIISYVGAAAITEAHVAEVLGVADRSLTRSLVGALAAGNAGAALGGVEQAIERGVDEVQLARALVRYLRDLSVLQAAPDRGDLVDVSEEERADLVVEAKQLERSRVIQMFERMLRCCDDLGKTLMPRLVLDCALIDVATIEPLIPLGDLIERLGELEARIAGRGVRAASGPVPGGAPPTSDLRNTAPGHPTQTLRGPMQTRSTTSAAPANPNGTAPRVGLASHPSKPIPKVEAGGGEGRLAPNGERSEPYLVESAASGSGPTDDATLTAETGTDNAAGSGFRATSGEASADPLAMWSRVLALLEERRRFSLLGPFQHARVLRWATNEIELGFPVDVHSMGEMAADKENLEEMLAILREYLGQPGLKLKIRLLDSGESSSSSARSLLETTRDKTSAERGKREMEAREHPITKHILQTFGAQIKEIKTDV
jgi:DNA polymerase-3 subunit gamma/tau